jgi:hypothetical protein
MTRPRAISLLVVAVLVAVALLNYHDHIAWQTFKNGQIQKVQSEDVLQPGELVIPPFTEESVRIYIGVVHPLPNSTCNCSHYYSNCEPF